MNVFSQCLEIETILVDACDDSGDEGFNEMAVFRTGSLVTNTTLMNVNWPSQSWQGLIQNGFTASKVATLNAQIAALGGCGRLIEPLNNIILPNSKVILITSQNFSLTANVFGALTQDVYILFQDNTTVTGGHFGNYNATSGIRTLTISLATCTDSVSYDRSLLVDANGLPGASNGATVNFTAAGIATYTNNGCVAPIDVFTVDAGNPFTVCAGATITLAATAQGQASVSWSAPSGAFSNDVALNSNYTVPFSASGTIVLTIIATNSCGNSITDTVSVTVSSSLSVTPTFTQVGPICYGAPVSALPTTSLEGITGTWSSALSNTQTGTYNFTPTSGQCATLASMTVFVNTASIISITNNNPLCNSAALSWATWDTVSGGSAQGTVGSNIHINVTHSVGGLSTTTSMYNGGVFPTQYTVPVSSTSLRNDLAGLFTFCFDVPVTNPQVAFASIGQSGTPVQINTSVPYVVTWAGQDVTYLNGQSFVGSEGYTIVTFPGTHTCIQFDYLQNESYCNLAFGVQDINCQIAPICAGESVTLVAHGASNYIWNPSVGLDTSSGATVIATPSSTTTYRATDPSGCYIPGEITVTVNQPVNPTFQAVAPFCSGSIAPTLPTTSLEGITGTWLPAMISNTANDNYTFTPNSGQCATNFVMSVTVTNANIVPDFASPLTLCSGSVAPILNTTSPNGIVGVWSPTTINNTTSNNYTFTPNSGQCATNFVMSVTVTNANIVPDFASPLTLCSGSVAPILNTTSPNGIVGVWSPTTINNTTSNNYTFTPNSGQCATNFVMSVTVTSANIVPNFASPLTLCSGSVAPILNTTSPNGITGIWSPSVINNTIGNTYTFNPNPGQCATSTTLTVTVTSPNIIPTFNLISPICVGGTLSPLPVTSTNGISGIWSPALDNMQTATYNFTPNAGQCAVNATLSITVNNPTIVPIFNNSSGISICSGDSVSFPTTSNNGITGTWSPAFNATQTQTYTFTPNTGQCALTSQMLVTVFAKVTPSFNPISPVCSGTVLTALPTTSLNGFTGTWSPAIDNTQTRTYDFIPDVNQCATNANLTITITPATLPTFNPIAPVCVGTTFNPLPSTSLNGIAGTWSPPFDNTISQLYTFTPIAGQCATTASLNITVAPNPIFSQTAYICFDAVGLLVNPATIDSGLSSADYTFVWTQDGNPLANTASSLQATQIGIYEVIATNNITHCTITIETSVQASPIAFASAYVNEDFADVQQIIVETTGGLGEFLYQLNYGPFQPSPIFTITEGGDYTIHVKDVSGCNTFELHVTALNFPKFFTPNDDGYNDLWNVDGLQASQNGRITIFDRYGKLLKQISANGEGWNGIYNGKILPATDYWFVIAYQSLLGESKTFRSHFSLKR